MKKKIATFFLLLAIITPSLCIYAGEKTMPENDTAKKEQTDSLSIQSVSAVLLEGATGQIIYEKDKDKQLVPASITKIMTLNLIFDALESGKIKLEDTVTVSEYAAKMGGSQVYLEPGETQSVNDMIKCISIASANDAAVAMAEKVAGSEAEFVKKMNDKARELGMKNTNFKNCTGLDDSIESGHYSSAYDVALMSRELITKHPQITKYSTVWMDKITHTTKKGTSEFGLTNTNKLVRFYEGITGLKTGSTSKAKYCLSATAKRNNMDLIAVVMAAPDHKLRFSEASALLDYGFAKCSFYTDNHEKQKFDPVPIQGGIKREITPIPETAFHYTFTTDVDTSKITSEITYLKQNKAPIKKGALLGKITYYYQNNEIGFINLVAGEDIKKASYSDLLVQMIDRFFTFD